MKPYFDDIEPRPGTFPRTEPDVRPLPDSVTNNLTLKYDPVSIGEIIWFEAGKVVQTITVYSKLVYTLINIIIKITGATMEDKKPWWLSRTIIGGALMAIVTVLQFLKIIPAGAVDVAETTDQIVAIIGYATEFIGFILVVVGRIKATKQIG